MFITILLFELDLSFKIFKHCAILYFWFNRLDKGGWYLHLFSLFSFKNSFITPQLMEFVSSEKKHYICEFVSGIRWVFRENGSKEGPKRQAFLNFKEDSSGWGDKMQRVPTQDDDEDLITQPYYFENISTEESVSILYTIKKVKFFLAFIWKY